MAKPSLRPGDELVDIGLVPGVPQDDVAGRVEDPVDGQGELDGPEVGAEVAPVHRDPVDDAGPDLGGQLGQLCLRQFAEVGGFVDVVEEHGHLFGDARGGDPRSRYRGPALRA